MKIASLKEAVSAEGWKLRVDLAAAYRLVAAYGWSDLVFTHSSARIPGPAHTFLIDPYGLVFDEITASSLVLVDQQCNKLRESPFLVNPVGFTLHRCIHEARDDADCILHTHSRAGLAVSAKGGCAAAEPAVAECRRRRLQPARRRALRRRRPAGAKATVALHHPPGAGQRTRADQRRRAGGASRSRQPGATAPRTWSCPRWSSCSGWPHWYPDLGCI